MKYRHLLVATLLLAGCSATKHARKLPPPRVEVSHVVQKTVPEYVSAIGHFTAYNEAAIKARVEGELFKIHYAEGKRAQKGDLLVTLDPRPYEATLAKTRAELAKNIASLNFAKEKVGRYETLVSDNYVSKLNFDSYVTTVQELEAAIDENQAEIADAEVNLSYCYIKAPFTGRIGKQLVDEGNMIQPNGDTLLQIRQLDPLYVDFTVSERDLPLIQEYQKDKNLPLHITLPDRDEKVHVGELIVIDNKVDESIGMVGLRGIIQNEEELLWPGQFIRVKVVVKEKKGALLVPQLAIGTSQKGKFVYVVHDDVAEMRIVKIGNVYGDLIEITSGLSADELVITKGKINVRPGGRVNVVKEKTK